MSLVKGNPKSQKLGLVEILYTVGHYEPTDFNLVRKKHALRSCLPMKPAAVHVCTDNAMIKAIVKFARPLMNLHTTSRIRISCGKFCAFLKTSFAALAVHPFQGCHQTFTHFMIMIGTVLSNQPRASH